MPGEVVGLVGDNGAGKSTLVKVLSGIHPADEGDYLWEGQPVKVAWPEDATRLGISTVYQDLALCDNLDVVENLYLGREARSGGLLDEVTMEHRANELLAELSVTTIQSVRGEVGAMSGGQRQSVAIARSLLGEPKLVVLDEPTAALGVAQTAQVLALITRLKTRGLGVIVISHNLVDVFKVVDRIFVMRLGAPGGEFDSKTATEQEVVAAITGLADRDGRTRVGFAGGRRRGLRARRRCRNSRPERTGDLGSMRVLLLLAIVWVIFQSQESRFLSATNLVNLSLQIAPVALISVGIVLVLLLGEIDLSVGAVSGLTASIAAVLAVKQGWSPVPAMLVAIAAGASIGAFQGFVSNRFGIPRPSW